MDFDAYARAAVDIVNAPLENMHDLATLFGEDSWQTAEATERDLAVLRRAKKLKVVGRAGVGVDNVAMDVATELGIAVINAPAGNTIAVAELVFGVLLSLVRHLPRASDRGGRGDAP